MEPWNHLAQNMLIHILLSLWAASLMTELSLDMLHA